MKTKLTLLCLLICLIFTSRAQTYVTIPDTNFVMYLQSFYPSCMSGNQMNISCPDIQNATYVYVASYGITDLTGIQYFTSLEELNCRDNMLTSLPSLANSIRDLNCEMNQLTSLPVLPDSLRNLNFHFNQVTTLTSLPDSIKYLDCSDNLLPVLPALPSTLHTFFCYGNQLHALPFLPSSVAELWCFNNHLTSLPVLPGNLMTLECSYNQLTSLPALSNTLQWLYCNNNQLVTLPTMPDSVMIWLDCGSNMLISLPELPESLVLLYCDSNNISCFPIFPPSLNNIGGFNISANPFSCLPNYVAGMDAATLAYPLCIDGDITNNPNGCPGAHGILGTIYNDNDNNCIYDAADQGFENFHLKQYDLSYNLLGQVYSFSNGLYNFPDSIGTYIIQLETIGLPYTTNCGSAADSTITLTATQPVADNVNFNITCKPGFDVGVQSVHRSGWVFPGLQHRLNIAAGDLSNWYNLNCAAGVNGQVQITVTGPVTFDSIVPGSLTPSVFGNVFTYNVADYGNVNINSDFELLFTTDTTAQIGDTICVNVSVTPSVGDNNTSNNNYQLCYNVVSSYDPNMKEVYPVNVQPGYQDWLTYTIHFQNTGNAPAMNIRLTDTLDTNMDLETFQVINYSHYNTVSMNTNRLTFHFPNIQLPDSLSDPEGSKGFVQYRIKPIAGLPMGTAINNTAYIYFDYNPAIVTNTTTNLFDQPLSIKENREEITFSVYPNPGSGKYSIELSEVARISGLNIEVYNLLGALLLNNKVQNNLTPIDLSDQPNGVYIIKVKGAEKPLNQRLIKQ